MAEIERELDEIITKIDREGNYALLPKTNTPIDKYDSELKSIFESYQLLNLTEFDYGRSYRYGILFTTNPDADVLENQRLFSFDDCAEVLHDSKNAVSRVVDVGHFSNSPGRLGR